MGVNCPLYVTLAFGFLATTIGLKCYLCGQYNDGVGSITPCLNHTHMALKDCPQKEAYCIKYQSQGTLVRDCVGQCTDRESWNSETHCCNDIDGCNSSKMKEYGIFVMLGEIIFILLH